LQIATEKCFVCTVSNTCHNNGCTSSSCGINNQTFASIDGVRDLLIVSKFDSHISGIVHKAMDRANFILKTFHGILRIIISVHLSKPVSDTSETRFSFTAQMDHVVLNNTECCNILSNTCINHYGIMTYKNSPLLLLFAILYVLQVLQAAKLFLLLLK